MWVVVSGSELLGEEALKGDEQAGLYSRAWAAMNYTVGSRVLPSVHVHHGEMTLSQALIPGPTHGENDVSALLFAEQVR
jgi:exopolyphosphatase/pppGpp-phosphohydrolase